MRVQTIAVIVITTASLQAKSQSPIQLRNPFPSYILLVEVLSKPTDTIEWLGTFKSLWAKPLKDYRGNFGNRADSIAILIDLRDTHDISMWPQIERGDKLIVFVTGTSLLHRFGCYFRTMDDHAIGHRKGHRDRDGFQIGDSVVTYSKLKNAIDSANCRDKIEEKDASRLARYHLPDSWFSGGSRLWGGKYRKGSLYADGVYVAFSESENNHKRHIYTYKRGRIHMLTKGSDDKIVEKVHRFLIRQDCNDQELQECLEEVQFHLDHRTTKWSLAWGPEQRNSVH